MQNNRPHITLLLVACLLLPGLFLGAGTPTTVSADTPSVAINFQPSSASTPDGYLVDSGAAFGDRGNGWSYGWSSPNDETRDRNLSRSPDQRYDTLNHMQKTDGLNWEIALRAGTYEVHLVAGDPGYYDSVYKIAVEDTLTVDGTPDGTTRWLEGTVTVTVTDGRLTVSNASGSSNNKINYIEITATDGSSITNPITPPSATPATPTDLVTNVAAASGDTYPVESLQEGTRTFIDRSYTVTSMPTGFAGQPFIRTANDDKWATVPDFLRFELTAGATVYVAYDSRAQALPAWLAEGGWTETGDLLGTSDVERRLYRKSFPAGLVVLGGNAMAPMLGAESNYNVVVIAEDAPAPAATPTATGVPSDVPTATATGTAVPSATATETAIPSVTATTTTVPTNTPESATLDQTGTQWAFLEWSLDNPTYSGNPFDLVAAATFVHQNSGETRTTEMFYDGGDTWKFRFTGTQAGTWTVTTSSNDADLDRHSGTIEISAGDLPGFVVAQNGQWVRSGTGQAFVPRYAIQAVPGRLSSSEIDRDIQTFIRDAGFTGFHISMGCSWFDAGTKECDQADNTDPDRATFQIIEELITETYAAGGAVHLWMWGDSSRDQNPTQGMDGLNGTAARRVQRYIAARLGPLPGWTMGYGYDVWEWADSSQVQTWHDHMQAHLGWDHLLGARYKAEQIGIWTDALEYAAYEQVKPTYDDLRQAFDHKSTKPAFSEDRWRNLDSGSRDFSEDELRRVAWNAVMSGGVAGIYGNLTGGQGSDDGSKAFGNADQFLTLARFWEGRYTLGVARCNDRTDAVCLQSGDAYSFYGEDVSSIQIDGLSGQRGVAVDTRKSYQEITFTVDGSTWTAPYRSDWAIAIEP